MIHITGDTHGDSGRFFPHLSGRCPEKYIEDEKNWDRDDILIILGDFGFIWYNEKDCPEGYYLERSALNKLKAKPYTILFIDGNHENFDRLESEFEVVEKFGAPAHRIADNIFHLMRGEIYTIEGKTFFCMGGAYSIDTISAGRKEGISVWKRELPSEEEYLLARKNLEQAGNRVDYILTHTAPAFVADTLFDAIPDTGEDRLRQELQHYMDTVFYKHWFFGHWHTDREITGKMTAVLFGVYDI